MEPVRSASIDFFGYNPELERDFRRRTALVFVTGQPDSNAHASFSSTC
jgi:hypothetical protein